MKTLKQLREEHDALNHEMRAYSDKHAAGWNNENQRWWDESMNKLSALASQINARIDQMQEFVAGSPAVTPQAWRDVETGQVMPVMRTVADFRAYYGARAEQKGPFAGSKRDDVTLVDFVRGVAGLKTSEEIRAALSIGTDSAGGYTVPHVVMPELLAALTPVSALLAAGVAMVPMTSGAKSVTAAAVDTVPTASWRSEAGNVAESDPTFRAVTITPRSLAFYFKVSRELLADSPNMGPALQQAIAQAMAKELDRAGLRGSGTAPEIRGILNTPGVNSITNGANGASLGTIKWANLLSAYQAIRTANAPAPTAAIMSPRTMVGFASLADSTAQPLQRPDLLRELRFIDTSQVPNNLTVGTSTDCSEIFVGAFDQLQWFMRETLSIQLLKEAFATTGQLAFLCHSRADLMVTYPTAFAVATGVRP